MQCAFETLRAKFAESIFLVHPDEEKEWVINTDASGKAIGSVLMQQNEQGNFNIISTASRVLKPAEQRYTTCEKELFLSSMHYNALRFTFMGVRFFCTQIIKSLHSSRNVLLPQTE